MSRQNMICFCKGVFCQIYMNVLQISICLVNENVWNQICSFSVDVLQSCSEASVQFSCVHQSLTVALHYFQSRKSSIQTVYNYIRSFIPQSVVFLRHSFRILDPHSLYSQNDGF